MFKFDLRVIGFTGTCFLMVSACGDSPRENPIAKPKVIKSSPATLDSQTQLNESLAQAIEAAESILKITPDDKEALLAAALASEHLGLRDKTLQYYLRLQEVTKETEYLGKLAELQMAANPVGAAQVASKFFEQGGSDDRLRLWLIQRRTQNKEFREAYILTEKLPPPADKASREFLRDLCLRQSQNFPSSSLDALAALRRAASFDALPASLAETVALTLLSAGDAQAARDLLKTYPGPAHIIRAKIADKLSDPQEALSQRLKYFYSGGQDPQELLTLLDSLGRAPPARQVSEHLWRAGNLDFRSRLAVGRKLAQFYRDGVPPDTAAEIKFLEDAKQLGDPAFLDRLAELQQAIGNARAALAALRSRYPVEIPDNKADIYVTQALSAGEAEDALRVALRAAPSSLSLITRRRLSEIMNASAEMEMTNGKLAGAKIAALNAGRFQDDARHHRILARIFLLESDTAAAFSHLMASLKMAPTDPQSNYQAGKILFDQSRFADAKPYLQLAYAARLAQDDLPLLLGRIHFLEKSQMSYPLLKEYAQGKNGQVSQEVEEWLGRSASLSGQYEDASNWYEKRLKRGDHEQLAAEYLSALTASRQKARALGAARTLAVKYPSSRSILETASNIFDFSTDSTALLKSLESLSSLEPDPLKKSSIQRRLLDVKIRMGRNAEADDLLTALLDRFPNDAQLLTAAWNLRKGTSAAEPILKRLANIRTADDPIHLIRARQLMDDEDRPAALKVVREYLSRKKGDPDALSLLGDIHSRMGNKNDAASAYRELLNIRKDEPARQWMIHNIYDLAISSLAIGKPLPGSANLYAEAKELLGADEKYQDLYENFGKLFSAEPHSRSLAIDAFQKELQLTSQASSADRTKRARLTETLGQLYLADGQLSLARDMFVASQSAGNSSASFLRSFANLLARTGETTEADTQYRLLLKQLPYDRESNLFMARRSVERGKTQDALRSLEALRMASPSDSTVLDALGRAYVTLGRHAAAADVWQKLADHTSSLKYTGRYADALYESGRYKSALAQYRLLYSSGLADIQQTRRLAELEQTQGNWESAEEIILKLLRMGGTSNDRDNLAQVLRRIGDHAVLDGNVGEATRTAERLLALHENDPSAFILMGRVKLLEGKAEAALESYTRARSLAPKDPKPLLALADLELRRQRPVAALDFAKKALELDPSLPEAYTLIGLGFQRSGDVKHAYEAFKQAILYSNDRAVAHVRMGDLFLQHGKYNVALQQYRQALAIDPKNALAHLRNAVALHKLGFSENAMKELLMAMDLDPAGVGQDATVLLSEMFVQHGDVEKAREVLESAAAKSSAPPSVLFRLGEIARRDGQYEKSIKLFRDALLATGDPALRYDVLNALGLSLTSLNSLDAAEKIFKEAVSLVPARPQAFLNLSLLHRSRKNFLAAVDNARRAIAASPNDPDCYKLLGLIYYESGWRKESLSAFRESLRLSADQPEILNLVRSIESGEEQ